jgi:hypothetical protein
MRLEAQVKRLQGIQRSKEYENFHPITRSNMRGKKARKRGVREPVAGCHATKKRAQSITPQRENSGTGNFHKEGGKKRTPFWRMETVGGTNVENVCVRTEARAGLVGMADERADATRAHRE